jgi:Zn-dependent peptidase ImmA (M78 family)/DNA-binding XRE family transcriptional regulator
MKAPMTGSERFNPEMLTIAREARGRNQTEVAEACGVTQAQISRIENGLREPPPELVGKIGAYLKYRETLFYRREEIKGIPEGYTRARVSLSVTMRNQIEAEVNLLRAGILRLLKAADIEAQYPLPMLDLDEYNSPADAARAIRSSWALPRGPVKNLMRSLEKAGVILVPCDFGPAPLDAFSWRLPGEPPFVFYNTHFPPDRLRFTLAHELGHLVLHRVPHPKMEAEANQFAAEFLLPEREIRHQLPDRLNLSHLAGLKPVWRVSMGALLQQAKNIERITYERFVQLRKQFSSRGYSNREPPELDFPAEEPSNLRDLLKVHVTDLGYSADEVSEVVDLLPDEFATKYGWADRPMLRLVAS